MLLRRAGLLLGCLALCSAIQYTHLDSECAFYLDGAGRTTLYDYSLNLLRGPVGFGAAQPCITFDAINQAYIDARKRIPLKAPAENEEWMPHHVGSFGELLLDITKQLTRTYGLTVDEVEKGLPLIDTSKTLIKEVCPPYLGEVECRPGKYRRLDGLCNNVRNPTWGAANTPFTRLVSPQFADGIDAPRASVLGHPLPIPRIVSRTMHPDEGFHDHAGTVMVVAWGQFMDHDFTLTATPLDPRDKNEPEECCKRPPHLKHPYCLEIEIPDDDYFYHKYGVKCQDFVRSFPAPRPGCRLGSKVPYNTLTGVIDGNTVYGVTDEFGRHLRSGYGGQLRMNPVFSEYGLKDLLPLKLDVPDEGCTRTNASQFCFEAGEIRVNEQLVLTCMHTLMAREHNRIAAELATINPHWDDETLYQESRRIVIAEIQHITFNEFLPIILGKEVMQKFDLIPQKDGYWDGYDTEINPNIIDAFSAAAFRFGHSLLPTAVERWSKAHKFIASKRLSDLIRRPYDLYRAGVMDEYFMGLMNQVAQAMDDSITQEVTNHLLKKPGNRFGLDLVAFNMQRGREFGVPGYMEFRKFCGLPAGETFEELFGTMPNTTVFRYLSIFDHPSDVDLWSGGVSERPLPGSMIGPTFACIIATQMSYIRRGDRFWYELPNQPSSFTPEQLQEIRKIKLSRVICDNTDLIDTIQIYPMVLPDHEINPRVPCKSSIIPSIDLTKWAEFPHAAESQHVPYVSTLDGSYSAYLKK
ncbi:chorion peroxidase [Nilaparvata lugens]|uniref:chorion peroxidase n=1 Tax=Nilaparvata lugens TaxID=108931 RepID=UPI00193E9604|nr:chorion peroxidase [Nilaparvata lugens]